MTPEALREHRELEYLRAAGLARTKGKQRISTSGKRDPKKLRRADHRWQKLQAIL
jgi:hypothetical protein